MSHGKEGNILCSDKEEIIIDEALEKFNNVNCETILGQPKLVFTLFIQTSETCRGRKVADPSENQTE